MIKLNFSNLTKLTFLMVITHWGMGSLVVISQSAQIATVTVISDKVDYKKSTSKTWVNLNKSKPQLLFPGDLIRTLKTGRARIKCSRGGREWPVSPNQIVGANKYCMTPSERG